MNSRGLMIYNSCLDSAIFYDTYKKILKEKAMNDSKPISVPAEVKSSEYGCRNCLWCSCECKNGSKYSPRLIDDKIPSCSAYVFYD